MTIIVRPVPNCFDSHCEMTMKPTPAASKTARRLRQRPVSKLKRTPIHKTYGAKSSHANTHGELIRAKANVSRNRSPNDLTSSGPTRITVSCGCAVSRANHQIASPASTDHPMKNSVHRQRREDFATGGFVTV